MVLNAAGLRKGWQTENMPFARVMGDAILMLDGTVLIINGAQTGVAGCVASSARHARRETNPPSRSYGNVKDEVGASNARSPAKEPILYDPTAANGKRFSRGFPNASYERLYHSTATLIPDGRIAIMGSNPNDGVSTKTYRTRYNVEMLSRASLALRAHSCAQTNRADLVHKPPAAPYMSMTRPTFSGQPANMLYKKSYTLSVNLPSGTKKVQAFIMDLGYSTHGVRSRPPFSPVL